MNNENGKLVIARHGESEWNDLQRWTGQYNSKMNEKGYEMSEKMAKLIEDIKIDRAFTSELERAYETLRVIMENLDITDIPITETPALNERDYGDYTGEDKWEMKEILGEERFNCIRRGWDCPVPNGETLKIVYERVIPYYKENILPELLEDKNILIVAHTNSIRALVKYIEKIPDDKIKELEIPFETFIIYNLDNEGRKTEKEIRDQK